MKIPKGLQPLLEDGMIDTVVRRLKSGNEASVYIVACAVPQALRLVSENQTAWRPRRQAYTAMPNHTTFRPTDGHAPFQPLLMINPTAPRMFIHW